MRSAERRTVNVFEMKCLRCNELIECGMKRSVQKLK